MTTTPVRTQVSSSPAIIDPSVGTIRSVGQFWEVDQRATPLQRNYFSTYEVAEEFLLRPVASARSEVSWPLFGVN